jgi:diguanylate cyclase (GGDEF)-like protein
MDLDRFKTINDSLGHLTGDHVLITTAQRLKRSIRPMDVVARFAGDEFALVLENVESEDEVFEIVSRAQTVMAEPINVENHEIISTSSAGIAMGSSEYENASDLLRDADNALYKAKADGAGRCRMFDSSMHELAVKTLHLEADLRRVIERHQLRLYFQPLIDLKTGQIERFEALLRWKHPDRGIIMPDQFMPIAEETGLIFALDEWVVGEACRWWKRWHGMLNGSSDQVQDLRMNLNLSPRHFGRHINLAERLVDIIHGEGLQPDLFGLELTENAILTFRNETTTALHALKDAGFSLYLDDFGKGYSSLSYLHSFPFDMVKIDRQFIIRMQNEGPEREIVQAILALAGKLNLGVVAEGIETAAQMEIVRDLGCDLAQGFFISKPVTPNEAMDLMASDCRW